MLPLYLFQLIIFIEKYSPHKIIVNGEDQKDCFIKYLYWPKKLITVKPSVRFFKAKNNNMR